MTFFVEKNAYMRNVNWTLAQFIMKTKVSNSNDNAYFSAYT